MNESGLYTFPAGRRAQLPEGCSFRIVSGSMACYLEDTALAGEEPVLAGTLREGDLFPGSLGGSAPRRLFYCPASPVTATMVSPDPVRGDQDLLRAFGRTCPEGGFFYSGAEGVISGEGLVTAFLRSAGARTMAEALGNVISERQERAGRRRDPFRNQEGTRRAGQALAELGLICPGSSAPIFDPGALAAAVRLLLAEDGLVQIPDLSFLREDVDRGGPDQIHRKLRRLEHHGIRIRRIALPEDFDRRYFPGSLLVLRRIKDGSTVPGVLRFGPLGCRILDPVTMGQELVSSWREVSLLPDAWQFYTRLEGRTERPGDLISLMRPGLPGLAAVLLSCLMTVFFAAAAPGTVFYVASSVIPRGAEDELLLLIPLLLFLALSGILASLLPEFIARIHCGFLHERLQIRLFHRLLRIPVCQVGRLESGELLGRLKGAESLRDSFQILFAAGLAGLSGVIAGGAVMLWLGPLPGVICAGTSGCYLLALLALSRRQADLIAQRNSSGGHLDGMLRQFFASPDKIRSAGAGERILGRTMGDFSRLEEAVFRMGGIKSLAQTAGTLCSGLSLLMIFLCAGGLLGSPLSLPQFLALVVAFGFFRQGVDNCARCVWIGAYVRNEFGQIAPLLNAEDENAGRREDPGHLDGSLEMSHVTFTYPGAAGPALEDVSLRIRPGEFVALVGRSGSGKSSLIRLLLGLERPDSGVILCGGHDLADLDLGLVRSQMGAVMQGGGIFPGTVLDNVRCGREDCSEEDVVRALRLAALEMVETFPMGIRTRISRDTLSGGQQQRILIARALLGSPGILFLDEATSALDSITQKQIQDRLEHMRITRVVAAHRLSTVRNADRILVLERGRVIRSGTFDELSAGDGLFRRLLSGMDSGEGRDMGSDKL